MRIPADLNDADIVLSDCETVIRELTTALTDSRRQTEEARKELGQIHQRASDNAMHCAKAESALSQARGEWVACSDRFPMAKPYSSRVLIAHHYYGTPENTIIAMAWTIDGKWYYDRGGIERSIQDDGFIVTHWRPLPPPPTAQNGGAV
jgi:hypothetical protein